MKKKQKNLVIAAFIFSGLALYWYFNLREGWLPLSHGVWTREKLQQGFYSMCGDLRHHTYYHNTEHNRNNLRKCAIEWCTNIKKDGQERYTRRPGCVDSCAWEFPTHKSAAPDSDDHYKQHWEFCKSGKWLPGWRSTIISPIANIAPDMGVPDRNIAPFMREPSVTAPYFGRGP